MYMNKFIHVAVLYSLITLLWYAECIMFHLPSNNRKCLREELKQNALISGEYEVSEAPNQRVDYVVMSIFLNFCIIKVKHYIFYFFVFFNH